MLILTLTSIKSKPAGRIFSNAQGESWITMGSDYLNLKKRMVAEIKDQLPAGFKPLRRIVGLTARLVIKPVYSGHRVDLYNLIGFPPDVFTEAGVWIDDCETVTDSCLAWISRSRNAKSVLTLCETYPEYIQELNSYIKTLKQYDLLE